MAALLGMVACDKTPTDTPTGDAPVLTLTSEGSVWFEATGGEGVINYTLENSAKGVNLEATSSVEWISEITTGDSITYVVAQNDVEEERRGIITVTYGTESFTVSVMQRAMINADVTFEAKSLDGSCFYGKVEGAECYNYYLMLSTNGLNQSGNMYDDTSYYIFNLYAATGEVNGVATLTAGEYTIGVEKVAGVIDNGYSKLVNTTKNGNTTALFTDVRLVVSEDSIEAYITLDNGKKHHLTYEGSLVVNPYEADDTSGFSTLRRDYSFDISGGLFVGAYVGNMYYSGADTCQVYLFESLDIETGEEFGDEFQLDLQLPRGGKDICGTYTPGKAAGNFLIGWMEDVGGGQYMQTNTWYMTAGYLDFAPLVDGTITVEKDNYDIYTFTIDCIDDEGNRISGVFRGTGKFTEW